MFPSNTWHHVEPQTVNKERITLAFNLAFLNEDNPDAAFD